MKNLVKAAALAVLFGTAAFCGAAETITQKPDLNKIEQKIKSDLQQSIQKNGRSIRKQTTSVSLSQSFTRRSNGSAKRKNISAKPSIS